MHKEWWKGIVKKKTGKFFLLKQAVLADLVKLKKLYDGLFKAILKWHKHDVIIVFLHSVI